MRPVVALTDLSARGAEAIEVAARWAAGDAPLVVALQRPRPDPIAPLFPHRASPLARLSPAAARDAVRAQVAEVAPRWADTVEVVLLDPGPLAREVARAARRLEASLLVLAWPFDLVDADGEELLGETPCPTLVAGRLGPGPVVAVTETSGATSVAELAKEAGARLGRPVQIFVAQRDQLPPALDELHPRHAMARRVRGLLTADRVRAATEASASPTWVPLDRDGLIDHVVDELAPALLVCAAPGGGLAAMQRTLDETPVGILLALAPRAEDEGLGPGLSA